MSVDFANELKMLRETAARLVETDSPVSALRRLRDSRDERGFDVAVWNKMIELGWPALIIPESYGGLGFGFRGLGVVMEETGRTLTASPLLSSAVFAASVIHQLGTEAQKRTQLSAIAEGTALITVALEEGSHHAPFSVSMAAESVGDGFVLSGPKRFVLDGHMADHFIAVARSEGTHDEQDGLTLFLVDANLPGVEVTKTCMVDSRNAANIQFDGVKVGLDSVLGGVESLGKAAGGLERALDVARVAQAAEMVGGAREAFSRIIDYLKLREQFGVKIGSFQALKHRAAVMFTEIELAISAVDATLLALDEDSREVSLLASLAKAKANDVFHLVSSEGIQMFGGIGMTDDEDIGLYLKRSRVCTQLFGDTRFHRDRYARLCGF